MQYLSLWSSNKYVVDTSQEKLYFSILKEEYCHVVLMLKHFVVVLFGPFQVGFQVLLPNEAFITYFAITINQKTYEGVIKEKSKAKKLYTEAKVNSLMTESSMYTVLTKPNVRFFFTSRDKVRLQD